MSGLVRGEAGGKKGQKEKIRLGDLIPSSRHDISKCHMFVPTWKGCWLNQASDSILSTGREVSSFICSLRLDPLYFPESARCLRTCSVWSGKKCFRLRELVTPVYPASVLAAIHENQTHLFDHTHLLVCGLKVGYSHTDDQVREHHCSNHDPNSHVDGTFDRITTTFKVFVNIYPSILSHRDEKAKHSLRMEYHNSFTNRFLETCIILSETWSVSQPTEGMVPKRSGTPSPKVSTAMTEKMNITIMRSAKIFAISGNDRMIVWTTICRPFRALILRKLRNAYQGKCVCRH